MKTTLFMLSKRSSTITTANRVSRPLFSTVVLRIFDEVRNIQSNFQPLQFRGVNPQRGKRSALFLPPRFSGTAALPSECESKHVAGQTILDLEHGIATTDPPELTYEPRSRD